MNEKPQHHIFLKNLVFLRKHYEFSTERMADILEISVDELKKLEQGELPETVSIEVIFNAERFFMLPAYQLFEPLE